MNDTLTLISLLLAVLVASSGVWWKMQAVRNEDRRDADVKIAANTALCHLTSHQLAEYRTYVAEHYISKQGFRETMESVSQTLQTINTNLTHLNERIDRVIDNQHGSRNRERSN